MIFGVLGGSSWPNVLVENRFGFIQCAMGLQATWRIEKYLYPVVPPMIRCAQWRQPRTSWCRWNLSIRLHLYSAGGSTCRVNLCTYLTSTVEKINLATEQVRESDVRALTNTCPNITFLNLTETLVTLDVFQEMATTWSESMRYLSLPKRIAELNLASERVRYFQYLEDLPLLWRQGVINPRDTPILAIIAQFKTTVDSMSALKYLNIGNYSGNSLDTDLVTKSTLQRLFHHITINLSPYDDQYPASEDPCSVFQDRWIMNTDIESIPSLSPTSMASTIPIEDSDA